MRIVIHLFAFLIFLGMSACNTAPKSKEEANEGETAEPTAEVVLPAPNTLSELERNDGWILMFDAVSCAIPGAKNRTQAVAKGKSLGILPSN